MARAFGIDSNPTLKGKANATTELYKKALMSVIYNVDTDSMYRSLRSEKNNDAKAKRKKFAQALNLVGKKPKPKTDSDKWAAFSSSLMKDHFGKVAGKSPYFTMPGKLVAAESLAKVLDRPLTKRRKLLAIENDLGEGDAHFPDVDMDGPADESGIGTSDADIVFRVVLYNPDIKKTVPVAIGAGRKITKGKMVVAVHVGVNDSEGRIKVSAQPVTCADADLSFIFDLGDCDALEKVEGSVRSWSSKSLSWRSHKAEAAGVSIDDGAQVLDGMMGAAAYTGEHIAAGYVSNDDGQMTTLEKLRSAGLATNHIVNIDRWMLTQEGLRSLPSMPKLSNPQPVFTVRSNLALTDRTDYELVNMLLDSGWQWRPWIPRSQRRKSMEAIPDEYKLDAQLVFFTTASVHHSYLLALHSAQDRGYRVQSGFDETKL